jgi:hypothetical protein
MHRNPGCLHDVVYMILQAAGPVIERPGVTLAGHPGRSVVAVDAQSDDADPLLSIDISERRRK